MFNFIKKWLLGKPRAPLVEPAVRLNVTFETTLEVDLDAHPAGDELAEFLIAEFRARQIELINDPNNEDYALVLRFGSKSEPLMLLAYVGDEPFQWMIQINSGKFFDRPDPRCGELALVLHEILVGNSAFSEIRWHIGDFVEPDWTSTPVKPPAK